MNPFAEPFVTGELFRLRTGTRRQAREGEGSNSLKIGMGGGTPWDRVNVRLGPCAGLFGTRWKQWNPHIPMTSVVLTFNADITTEEMIS